ncbi:MAG TPA: VWA domain-containing protein [Rhizomicrobium sp.]|nr:VWA domain-containing protein [Rhizomicrobium sp.]
MHLPNSLAAGISRGSRLIRCSRANAAVIVALALVPVTLAAGAGLDYGRALMVRTRLAEALDAAALAVGATKGLNQNQVQSLAQNYFSANYNVATSFGIPGNVTVVSGTNTITLSDNVPVPTVLMQLAGIRTMNVSYSSQVTWGQPKLWLSLVLDNTGSMTQRDQSGESKIAALKTAVSDLLQQLNQAAQNPGDVMVSIVPFTTGVNVGTGNAGASWLTFSPWDAVGSGDGHYVNGAGQSCTAGTPGCSWVPYDPTHRTWSGCVMDRNQNNDVSNTAPTSTRTDFPAAPPHLYSHTPANTWSLTCPEQMMPLTDVLSASGYNQLGTEVTGMTAGGTTDQPVGLEMGWMTLTNSAPFNPGNMPSDTTPIVIIVSDGLNTQDRWTGDGNNEDTSTDAREALVCSNMKAAGITIYTVYVDLNGTQGNSAPLQNCASTPEDYFDLTTSNEIITTLNQITAQIIQLHVSK